MGDANKNWGILVHVHTQKEEPVRDNQRCGCGQKQGNFRELATIGVSNDSSEIESLCRQGKKWIDLHCGNSDIFGRGAKENEEKLITEYLLSNVEKILINGTQLILNRVFKAIGLDSVNDDILKHLVIARLSQPMSKAGTVDYLKSYFDEDVQLHNIYRYLDKLYNTRQDKVQLVLTFRWFSI